MPDPNPSQPAVPVYSGSVIENAAPSVLVITYSLSLANILPATTAFTVDVNGTNIIVNSISVSGNKVMVNFGKSSGLWRRQLQLPIANLQVIYFSLSSGEQAASLSAQSVKNNCTAPANKPPVVIISSPTKGSSYTSPAK